MVDLDRINAKDLYSNVADYIDYNPSKHIDASHQTCAAPAHNSPTNIPNISMPSRLKTLIKSVVKRTPLGWLIISKRRRKHLRDIFSDENKPTLDLNIIMGLHNEAFLAEIFEILLYRAMSHDEFIKFYTCLKTGMSKEAVVYVLCNSEEKDPSIAVESFCEFEKAYFRYIYKRRIISLPVLNYILALFLMPVRLKKLERELAMMDINSLDRFNGQLHTVLMAQKNIINHMKER